MTLPTLFGEKPCSSPQTISDSCSRGQLYMAARAVQGMSVTTVQARTGWARVMGVQRTGQGREARPASVKSSNPTSLHVPTWEARMGWLLTTVTFPFTPHSQPVLSRRKHGGETVMQAIVHCIVSHCCVCVPGRKWQWIARGEGCSLGRDLFRTLNRAGTGHCFVSFSVK